MPTFSKENGTFDDPERVPVRATDSAGRPMGACLDPARIDQLTSSLGLSSLMPGRQVQRDARGWSSVQLWVEQVLSYRPAVHPSDGIILDGAEVVVAIASIGREDYVSFQVADLVADDEYASLLSRMGALIGQFDIGARWASEHDWVLRRTEGSSELERLDGQSA